MILITSVREEQDFKLDRSQSSTPAADYELTALTYAVNAQL